MLLLPLLLSNTMMGKVMRREPMGSGSSKFGARWDFLKDDDTGCHVQSLLPNQVADSPPCPGGAIKVIGRSALIRFDVPSGYQPTEHAHEDLPKT